MLTPPHRSPRGRRSKSEQENKNNVTYVLDFVCSFIIGNKRRLLSHGTLRVSVCGEGGEVRNGMQPREEIR